MGACLHSNFINPPSLQKTTTLPMTKMLILLAHSLNSIIPEDALPIRKIVTTLL